MWDIDVFGWFLAIFLLFLFYGFESNIELHETAETAERTGTAETEHRYWYGVTRVFWYIAMTVNWWIWCEDLSFRKDDFTNDSSLEQSYPQFSDYPLIYNIHFLYLKDR